MLSRELFESHSLVFTGLEYASDQYSSSAVDSAVAMKIQKNFRLGLLAGLLLVSQCEKKCDQG